MSEPYLSEIRAFSFNFPPNGWALCNGQLLSIGQNQALFTLLGTTYGGDGINTFGLPNLQASVPLHLGNGIGLGATGGEATVVLNIGQIPAHSHTPVGSSNQASVADPSNAFWANSDLLAYASSSNVRLAPQAIAPVGSNQGHQNMSPFLVLSFCIALVGVTPPRN